MIILAGADLVLPDRVLGHGTLVIDGDRIADIAEGTRPIEAPRDEGAYRDLRDCLVLPGFIDGHVHGVLGVDTLNGEDAIETIARTLPRFGVTAFCPTSVACEPGALARMLAAIGRARATPPADAARVLPAHLESNFINPLWAGAQPRSCLRPPPGASPGPDAAAGVEGDASFGAEDILAVIDTARADVGIVTLAPELPGALDLVASLISRGHRVSLGHSGASFDEATAAMLAGARQVTHLYNRMSPAGHKEPGLAGAALHHPDLVAEIVCDGVHVHPAMVRVTIAAKQASRVMAITDGTAGSGLAPGARASLGGQPITVRDAAYLDDGTLAGSVLTMDRAFAFLTGPVGLGLVDAAHLCATTPARALGLHGHGVLAPGAVADLVVLDRRLQVVETFIGGRRAWAREEVAEGPDRSGTGPDGRPSMRL